MLDSLCVRTAFLVCLLGSSASSPAALGQSRTVLVPIVPGNTLASGQALVNALAAIPSPSAADPWLLQLEPGVYQLPAIPLQMRAGVSIAGSGPGATEIHGTPLLGPFDIGVVEAANNAELRDLVVEVDGVTGSRGIAVQAVGVNGSFRLTSVLLNASGSDVNCGLRNVASAPTVRNVDIHLEGGLINYGVVLTGTSATNEARRLTVYVSGANENYGIWVGDTSSLLEVRDSEITARGGSRSYGLFFHSTAGNQGTVQLSNVEIDAILATTLNAGIWSEAAGTLRIQGSDVNASGGSASYGLHKVATGGSILVSNSEIAGASSTVSNVGSVGLRSSALKGGSVTGSPATCAGVWDETGAHYAATCPQ